METISSEEHKETLGLCLIAKNEEKNISRCIESVRDIVDEIVVIDTGSTDGTVGIAQSLGAVIHYYPWDDNFSNARNYAMQQTKSAWLLLLDADEQVDPGGLETIVSFINTTNLDGAYFRVRNYIGTYSAEDYTLHNALRLLRNNGMYRYVGAIHEQIVCADMREFPNRFETLPVILNHYGYLNEIIAEKQKRKRNMPILKQELEKNPEDFFALYYLGNEYLALNDLQNASRYYLKSYEKAKKRRMVFAHLYLRMITCLEASGDFTQSLQLIDEALGAFPLCTDFEFVRAVIFFRTRRYTLAIRSLKHCLEMGIPPAPLEFMGGCGSYRAAYMLGDIYAAQEDYKPALEWYQSALRYKPDYYTALYQVGFALNKLDPDKDAVCAKLFSCFSDPSAPSNIITASDVLIREGLYAPTLAKLKTIPQTDEFLPEAHFFQAQAHFYLKNFDAAVSLFEQAYSEGVVPKDGRPPLRPIIALYLLTAGMLQNDRTLADRGLDLIQRCGAPDAQGACRLLYQVNFDLPPEDPHFKNEGEQEFETILTVYEIVLKLDQFALLNKLFGALTFIGSKSAAIKLAKLYWDRGSREQAAKLVFQSVKELDYLDAFGAEVLFKQIIP